MKKFLESLKQAGRSIRAMNLPNKLTLLRVALVPLYLVLLWFFDNDKSMQIWPLLVFTLASLTDLLDGYIARSRNPDYQLWQIHGPDCRQAADAHGVYHADGHRTAERDGLHHLHRARVCRLRSAAVRRGAGARHRGGHERQDQDRAANECWWSC